MSVLALGYSLSFNRIFLLNAMFSIVLSFAKPFRFVFSQFLNLLHVVFYVFSRQIGKPAQPSTRN